MKQHRLNLIACVSLFIVLPALASAQTFTWAGPPAIEPSRHVAALSDTSAVFAAEDGKLYLGRVNSGSATYSGHFTLDFNTAYALNAQTAFAGGSYDPAISESNLWRTNDGGQNWLSMTAVAGEVVDLQFVNADRGYALTNSQLFLTTDGGFSWNAQTVDANVTSGEMRRFYAANDTLLFIANNAGLYRSTGGTWTQVVTLNFLSPPSTFELVSGGGGLTLQADGQLYHATDAALETFDDKTLDDWPSLPAFDWLDASTAYGANGAALFRTTDGGSSWQQLDSARTPENTLLPIQQLDVISPSVVYAIDATNFAMWRTDNAFGVSRLGLVGVSAQVYPNPFSDVLKIDLPAGHRLHTATLHDLAGRVLMQSQLEAGRTALQFSSATLPAGVYVLQLRGETQHALRRVVKR